MTATAESTHNAYEPVSANARNQQTERIRRIERPASIVDGPHQDIVSSDTTRPTHTWRAKHLILLAVMQAACLVVGLGIYQPLTSASDHAVAGALSGISAMPPVAAAFLWIASAQGAIACVVFNRVYRRHRHQESEADRVVVEQQALAHTRRAVIAGLTKLAESRDRDTEGHLDRVGLYAEKLAEVALQRPEFSEYRTSGLVQEIRTSAALHDIGKVGIEDAILQKPGRFTADERSRMEAHPQIGGECIRYVQETLGQADFLTLAHEITVAHHERWDGTGYPSKLAGEAIPLSARIVAIADVYDALSVKRVYKDAYPHERCVDIIVSGAGSQFDPRLVEVFLKVQSEFQAIATRFPAASSAADDTGECRPEEWRREAKYRLDQSEKIPGSRTDRQSAMSSRQAVAQKQSAPL